MRVRTCGTAGLLGAAVVLVVAANAHAIVIPSVIDTTLTLPAGTHQLAGDTAIRATGRLECNGATIEAAPGALLKVYGVLTATGATFKAAGAAKWGGIEFRSTRSSASRLTDCDINDAGGAGHGGAIVCVGTLTVFPAPRLEGCRISRSAGAGVRSIGGRPWLDRCRISDCAGTAVRNTLGGYVYFPTNRTCRAVGNGSNTVTFDKAGHGVIFRQIWKPAGPGFPYRILGPVGTRPGGQIAIRRGLQIQMGSRAYLIADRGPINALGTARQPIVIRGIGTWRGQWAGIFIKPGGSPSVWEHCRVSNGGSKTCCSGAAAHLNLVGARNGGGVTVRNCEFSRGGGPGIWMEDSIAKITDTAIRDHIDMGVVSLGNSRVTIEDSKIEGNGRAGVYHAGSGSASLTPCNVIQGNGQFEVVNMSANDIPAKGNYWGVTTWRAINNRIFDGRDSAGLGLVRFWPARASAVAPCAVTANAGPLTITSATTAALASGVVQITYGLSGEGNVEAEVLNIAGRPIRRIASQQDAAAGVNVMLWDGKSDSGLAVPSGRYLIRLRATSPSGEQASTMATATVPPR